MYNYVLFGAGKFCQTILEEILYHGMSIKGIVDNDEKKWGTEVCGYYVSPPYMLPQLLSEKGYILISLVNRDYSEDVSRQLTDMGYEKGRDYAFVGDVFLRMRPVAGHVSGVMVLNDVNYIPVKTFDNNSRLIIKKDEKKIYRVVNKDAVERYQSIYNICKKNGLFGKYLVPTEIVELKELPFSLVLSHEYIEPISYCFEWSPGMICDYVRFVLDLIDDFADCNLSLCDGHMLNATLYKGSFLFIDYGAFSEGVMNKRTIIELLNTHVLIFILLVKGERERAYMYMKNPGIEFTPRDIKGYVTEKEYYDFLELYHYACQVDNHIAVKKLIKRIREYINEIKNSDDGLTTWSGYQNDEWEWSSDNSKWSAKMNTVISMIRKAKPSIVVDLAGNMGWYGSCLHKEYDHVVVMDYDYMCVDSLWDKVKGKGFDNVYPIYMSICAPTPDYYRDDSIQKTGIIPWRKNAMERFYGDLVIALAIIHHLVFSQQLSFEEAIQQISMFTRKYLIIEFVEQTDRYITDFLKKGFEWYTRDNFEKCLNQYYEILDIGKSTPSETRYIYYCIKKNY